jgi:hypothetical protein
VPPQTAIVRPNQETNPESQNKMAELVANHNSLPLPLARASMIRATIEFLKIL